jgi:hypothetical protein
MADSMNSQVEEWKARRKKWRYGIDIATSTKDDLSEYLNTKLYLYALYDSSDNNLWDLFKHDFKGFTRVAFNRLDQTELLRLRAVLRCGGVYVQQDYKNLTISQSLVNLVQEEEEHIWSAADIDEARIDLQKGPITSIYISLEKGNKLLQPLVFRSQSPAQPTPDKTYLRHLAEMERFNSAYKALPEPLPVESTFGALEALLIEAPVIEAPAIEAPAIEAPAIEALLIEALPVDTDTNEPAIPSANTTEPSVGDTFTFTIDYCFAGSSIPRSLSTTTLILPQSIPPTNSYLACTLTSTYTFTEFGFQALQRTGVG